jgi:hypothetical protein
LTAKQHAKAAIQAAVLTFLSSRFKLHACLLYLDTCSFIRAGAHMDVVVEARIQTRIARSTPRRGRR